MKPAMRTSFAPRQKPLFEVEVAKCVFTLQSISLPHLFAPDRHDTETGPIIVSLLSDGNYFVHNGRHRVIRARWTGETVLLAESLYDDDGTE